MKLLVACVSFQSEIYIPWEIEHVNSFHFITVLPGRIHEGAVVGLVLEGGEFDFQLHSSDLMSFRLTASVSLRQ